MPAPRLGFGPAISKRRGRLLLAFAVVTAVTSMGAAWPASTTRTPESDSTKVVGQPPATGLSAPSNVFDNFNRTVSNSFQTWGNPTAGGIWEAYACTGYTAIVNGQEGVMTGSAGAPECIVEGGNNLSNPNIPAIRFWDADSFAMTVKFKTAATDGSRFYARIATYLNANEKAGVTMMFAGAASTLSLGFTTVPMTYQADTWYTMKLVVIWGDQERVRIWPSGTTEPGTWLATAPVGLKDPPNRPMPLMFEWYSPFATRSVFVDDILFGPAPVLPKLPPPPTTEHNPPYVNEEESGDPVSTLTGTFSDTHVDVAIPGRGPSILFARSYNSNDTRVTALGPGWTHSYNIRLTSPDDGSNDVILVGPQGRSDRYVSSGSSYTAPVGVHRTLVKNPDETYTATDKDQSVWSFDASGRLTEIRDRFGNASSLNYDGSGKLSTVSDPAGRGLLTLTYAGTQLTSVTDWASPARSVNYSYDANGRLRTATDREGKASTYSYDGTSHRISSIQDARLITTLANTYDAQGRVATQKDGRGVVTGDATTFDYVSNPDGTTTTTLTAPVTSFEPTYHPTLSDTYDTNGFLLERVTHPTSTETLTQTLTYDSAGNQISATDPRGARTDFCYDVTDAGTPIAGGAANLTRTIGAAAVLGEPRPVLLMTYDGKSNLIRSVSPRGVPSGTSVTCSTDLSAVDPDYVTDQTFDAAGVNRLSSTRRFTDPNDGIKVATTKYEYGDAANPGRVTRVIPPRGNTTGTPDYTYATTMTYNTTGSAAGMLKDLTDALGRKTSYAYDNVGRLTSLVDPLGNAAGGVPAEHTTNYTYDKEDRLRTMAAPSPTPGGLPLITETRYDNVGDAIFRIDANGQVTGLSYDERRGLLQVTQSAASWTDPAVNPTAAIVTEYLHDAGGNAIQVTRAKGDAANERVTDYAFDGRGLRRAETQYPAWPSTAGALVTAWAYDADGNEQAMTDPLGQVATYGYDARNNLLVVDYSNPATPDVAFTYDLDDHRIGMTDGTGASTYAYDESGQLTGSTTPGAVSVGYRYDLDGHRAKLIYPDTTAVQYAYDKAGELSSLTDWASRNVTYTYWPDGLVQGATMPDSSVATYSYDNARRLVDVIHQRAGTTISHQGYTLDRVGTVTSTTDFVSGLTPAPVWSPSAAVNDTTTADQIRPALAAGVDGSVAAVWSDTRSGNSDVYFARRDPATGAWGPSERVNNVTTGEQSQPAVAIDAAGNAYVIWTDARLGAADDDIFFSKRSVSTGTWSASVRVNNDGTGKHQNDPTIAISSTGVAIAAWYDERGGGSKKYIYSARLPAGGSTWSTNYQVSSNSSAVKGDPEVAIGADGITYAAWRDLQSGNADIWFATLPNNGTTWSANTKISDDPGTAVQDAPDIGLDTAGNVLAVWNDARTAPSQVRFRKRPAGSSTWAPSAVLGGSTASAPSLIVRPDGAAYTAWTNGTIGSLTTVWGSQYTAGSGTWSAPEQLTIGTEESATTGVVFTTGQVVVAYQRRATGGNYDIHARRKALGGDESTFGYDRLSRLTSVGGPDGSRSYTYDPVGNRTTRVAGTSTAYTYDRADRLSTAGGAPVTSDANGNVLGFGSDIYTYDQANRLSTATVAGSTETYAYDGLGARFSRQVGAAAPVRYVSDVGSSLPIVIDDGPHKFVFGLGMAYSVTGSTIEVVHADRLGTPRAITNATGTVTNATRKDEWGLPRASTGSTTQPFGYTGEPSDATGLTYLRARYYSAELGRFISRDSWFGSPSSPQSMNRYSYSANNPTTRTDPSGHCGVDAIADVAFIVVDIGGLVFGPPKDRQGNWLALGADTAGLFIPCATGLGLATRGAREAAEHADDIGHGLNWVDDAVGAACSFTPDTRVTVVDPATLKASLTTIASVRVGDHVLAWDPANNEARHHRVTGISIQVDPAIEYLVVDGETIETTPNHRFLTEGGWVEARALVKGSRIQQLDGTTGIVDGYSIQNRPVLMWDLTVSDVHTFAVGDGQFVVHNSCPIDNFKHALDDDHLRAAQGDLAGNPILDSNGKPFDHLTEVQNAQRGLANRIQEIQRRLSYVGLGSEERASLEAELGEASRLLDYTEQFLPR